MKIILGMLVLLTVSSVSTTASAGKFDLESILADVITSVLSAPEKVRQNEHEKEQQRILDELNEASAQHELELIEYQRKSEREMDLAIYYSNNACDSIERCDDFPHKRRAISGDLENVPYICELDDLEGASRRINIERNRISSRNFVYASDQWLAAEKNCHQRLEAQKEENAQRIRRERDLDIERVRERERQARKEWAEISKRPEPKVGMTKDQVKKSRWGNPIVMSVTTDAKGTYEQWIYTGRTLYFTNGKLAKIEQIKF